VPNNLIYVLEDGAHDYSRWLKLSLRSGGVVILDLGDLCHPGMLSELKSVTCDLELIISSLATGALQVSVPNGYLLAARDGDVLSLEFKSYEDAQACRVVVSAQEVEQRLEALRAQSMATLA
jgi:hypothetical protein